MRRKKRGPCYCCGKIVAAATIATGKGKVAHNCPHGRPCPAGSLAYREGHTGPPPPGWPGHCPECWLVYRTSRRR